MDQVRKVSNLTRNNWILDTGLFLTALVASLSGIYFLVFPDGGYKGGRNPYYGIQIIFERAGWEWMHTWISLAMIVIALVHLIFHWKWVVNTTKRIGRVILERKPNGNRASWTNTLVDGCLGLGFLVCAISGIYLFFVPHTKGGLIADPMILFSRTAWDIIHTWSGVVFISAALIHFMIHWGWVAKVSRKMFTRQNPNTLQPVISEVQ
jgi:hypothetical protein